jgi:cyclohexadieny/prephenate dehydrogenase
VRVAILGLGLIGSSLAHALSEKKLATHIAAYNKSAHALDYAMQNGFIHSQYANPGEAVKNADFVVFATPSSAFSGLARDISAVLKKDAIITDVASVKRNAIEAIKPHLPKHVHYVPAHPITGSEKSGIEAGRADLFEGKKVVLTPEEPELMSDAVKQVRIFWEKLGAQVEFMPAPLHDLVYAYVSHLPHMVAFAVASSTDSTLENSSYQQFLRIGGADVRLWADICLSNTDYVGQAMDDFIQFAIQIYGELKERAQGSADKKDNPHLLFAGLVGVCLIATASLLQEHAEINPLRYTGAGFTDMTAVSSAMDPQELLAAVSASNVAITPLFDKMLVRLSAIRSALKENNIQKLAQLFIFSD